jgi:hypothetical protein
LVSVFDPMPRKSDVAYTKQPLRSEPSLREKRIRRNMGLSGAGSVQTNWKFGVGFVEKCLPSVNSWFEKSHPSGDMFLGIAGSGTKRVARGRQ